MRNLLSALILSGVLVAAASEMPRSRAEGVPLFFTENLGQLPAKIRFMAQGSGLVAYFAPEDIFFRGQGALVRAHFLAVEPGVRIEGIEPLPGHVNFLIGAEDSWQLGVPVYSGVAYRGLYSGID